MAVESPSAPPAKMGFSIRRAEPSDATAIAHLGAHTFSTTFGHSVTPEELQDFLTSTYTPSIIAAELVDPDRDVIVAVDSSTTSNPDDKKILGFAYLTRNSDEPCLAHIKATSAEMQRIYVDPAAHGTGVASALVREVTAVARGQGFQQLWLGVWVENYKAILKYEHWGYRKVGFHDFTVGSVVQRDHIMVKEDLSK